MEKHYKQTFDKINDEKRARILESAIDEFSNKGFSNANINVIANNAQISIRNALFLLKKNGYLIIHEPMFYPHCVMTVVFWTKIIISHLVSGRITILGPWNNIGEPVVSSSICKGPWCVRYGGA